MEQLKNFTPTIQISTQSLLNTKKVKIIMYYTFTGREIQKRYLDNRHYL